MLNFIPPPNDRKKRTKDELDVEEGDQEVSIYRSYETWLLFHIFGGALWSWSYGSWVYNCICHQCQSPLNLWVQIPLMAGVLDTTLCNKVCQWLATGLWFSPGSSTYKTDCHNITEIMLKVALTITLTLPLFFSAKFIFFLRHGNVFLMQLNVILFIIDLWTTSVV